MDQRRLLIAILLAFLVLTAYQWLVPAPTPQQTGKPVAAAAGPSAPSTSTAAAPAELPPVETVLADVAERTIDVDNGFVHATFSNRGATLLSWQLTQYRDSAGKPVDLVPHDMPPNTLKPFSLKLDDAAKTARVNGALYRVQAGTPDTVDATTSPAALIFEYEDASGLRVRKQFRFDPNSYIVEFTPSVTDGTQPVNPTIQWGPGLGDVLAIAGGRNVRLAEAIYDVGGKVSRVASNKLAATPRYQGAYEFAGVDTHYFISAAVKPGSAELVYSPLSVPSKTAAAAVSRDYVAYDIRWQSAPAGPTNARFFIGPKHFETLRQTDPELVRAIWFGMFAFLSVPLLSALNWVHGFIGNYGWSIIALTFIINAAMFPLRHKSNVSMRKMQEIQPQVKAIQDRYKHLKTTDPARQKMNTEMMELYRQKGVNPASGCVPMLLTFPVLLAFYSLLSEAIELRNAPFIWWIHDLAAPDPFYVTPILMGASQVLQQKMMPMTGADPVQQRMMLFMPIIFTFLFITSPAGLALYWFASNVLVIGQQLLTNRMIGAPVVASQKSKN
jgi:YidC/Oxa1 family membrane protein insertase